MTGEWKEEDDKKLLKSLFLITSPELSALAGVYLLLGMGMILGILILIFEHWFYKYTLPILRHKPNGTVWKSPNIMFFSQVRKCSNKFEINMCGSYLYYHDSGY